MHRIVVLGAGYAGLMTAVSLAGRTREQGGVRITVVNATERFTERLRQHQVAAGESLADLRIPALLDGTGVEFVVGWVTGIDATARTVRVDDERVLEYDTLVYALGGTADTTSVPGADEHAYVLDGDSAALLADRLRGPGPASSGRAARGEVVVCGSGLTGVEAAAEIAEQHPDRTVTLIGAADAPGANLGPKARDYLIASLTRLGVRIRSSAKVVQVRADGVELADGEFVPADAVLWTTGVRVSPLASAAGLATDDHGRIITDRTLRSITDPSVYAVGDAAAVDQPWGPMHGTCQSGMPTAVHAAQSIVRRLDGRAPRPFRYGYLHTPVSLGRHDAVIQFTRPDHTPGRFRLTGRVAVWYKETVSSSPWPSFRRVLRRPGLGTLAWRRGGRYTR